VLTRICVEVLERLRKPLLYPTELRGREGYDTAGIGECLAVSAAIASAFEEDEVMIGVGSGYSWLTRAGIGGYPYHRTFCLAFDFIVDSSTISGGDASTA